MSHSTLTIEEKVDKFNEESKVIFETIVEGSDEHLDRILSIITPLSSVTDRLSAFNEDIFENIGSSEVEDLRETIIPKLKSLRRTCLMVIGALRSCTLHKDLKQATSNFTSQVDFLREIISDIENFKLKEDKDFDNLLSMLNEL